MHTLLSLQRFESCRIAEQLPMTQRLGKPPKQLRLCWRECSVEATLAVFDERTAARVGADQDASDPSCRLRASNKIWLKTWYESDCGLLAFLKVVVIVRPLVHTSKPNWHLAERCK